jgi:hypothetical protein
VASYEAVIEKNYNRGNPKQRSLEQIMFSCGSCQRAIVVEVERLDVPYQNSTATVYFQDGGAQLHSDFDDGTFRVVGVAPTLPSDDIAPLFTPDNIARIYGQAVRATIRGDADVAGIGFRKALDISTKDLIRNLKLPNEDKLLKKNLNDRIKVLLENGRLTQDLADWAHILREEGNDAAHEEEPYSNEEADTLHEFCKVYLLYVYSLPGMIKARKGPPEEHAIPA